jgi:hypothetical protein
MRLERGRPWWTLPDARVRDIGYLEFADGYGYAQRLAGRAPAIAPPDAHEWLQAVGDPEAYGRLVERYTAAYAPLAAQIRRDTLHLVGNSHIDAAWKWQWPETIIVCRDTFGQAIKFMAENPDINLVREEEDWTKWMADAIAGNAADLQRFNSMKRSGEIAARAGIGGNIEIHGGGRLNSDWTDGCVSLKNADMADLYKRAYVGMPVTIVGTSSLAAASKE